jgi:hypothetical protein
MLQHIEDTILNGSHNAARVSPATNSHHFRVASFCTNFSEASPRILSGQIQGEHDGIETVEPHIAGCAVTAVRDHHLASVLTQGLA